MQKNRSQNMLIKEIAVENLKTFVNPQRLKLAPITLLYGENSSGKTSIMKILDILMNIFGYGYKRPITEVGDKFAYNSDIKKNISAERINLLSSFRNNKPIILKFKFDLKLSKNINDSMIFNKKDMLEKVFFNEYNYYPKNIDDVLDLGEIKTVFKEEKNLTSEIEFCIHLKYFKSKKLLNNVSKIDKIEINYKNKNLFTYKRENKNYKFIENRDITGFIEPRDRKELLKNYLESQDFFTSSSGYADYSVDINENSLIIEKSYKCYQEIIKGNKERLNKIKKIISYYKNYLSREYLFSIKHDREDAEIKKLKIFEITAKLILGNEKYDLEKLKTLDDYDIDKINDFLNKKFLKSSKLKAIFLFSNLLSNIRNEDIYNYDLILNKDIKYNRFSKIIISSFKEHFLRFTRSKSGLDNFPVSIIDKNLKNFHVYEKDFLKNNNITLPGVSLLIEVLFHIHDYLKNSDKSMLKSANSIWGGKKLLSDQLLISCKKPSQIIQDCLLSIFDIARSLERTSPNSTEETFSIFTNNDLKKFESLSIINQLSSHEHLTTDKMENNRKLLLEAANQFRKKKIDEKYSEDKVLMTKEDDDEDFFQSDPSKYYRNKKNISELGEAGEYFNSIIINNKSERRKLNKYLKRFFDLEIIVLDTSYFKKYSKSEQIKIRQVMYDADYKSARLNDKFIMIKDLKFKKNFTIHGIEIGKGPSNIFPFLLQILNNKPNIIFAIQELENNWHPKYHSKLILLLVEILKFSKNKSYILETHSEIFVLQIKKLVEKGILSPEDVSINFILRNKNGESEINNIPLNYSGGFEKPWPGGFFTERMEVLTS